MFGELIIGYLFLGGAGSAALAMLGGRECLCALREGVLSIDCREELRAYGRMPKFGGDARAWMLCLVFLGLGAAFLLADLGRPDRILQVVFTPRFSAIAVGTYALCGCLICAAVFSADRLLDAAALRRVPRIVLGALSTVVGVTCSIYTGVLLQGMASVAFWQTPLVLVLFVISSFSCGMACVAMSLAWGDTLNAPPSFVRRLMTADAALVVLEVLCLGAYLVVSLASSDACASANALVSGEMAPMFWIGVVGVGLVLPFLFEVTGACRKSGFAVCLCAIAVLLGGIVLRLCVVEAAMFDLTNTSELVYGLSLSGPRLGA